MLCACSAVSCRYCQLPTCCDVQHVAALEAGCTDLYNIALLNIDSYAMACSMELPRRIVAPVQHPYAVVMLHCLFYYLLQALSGAAYMLSCTHQYNIALLTCCAACLMVSCKHFLHAVACSMQLPRRGWHLFSILMLLSCCTACSTVSCRHCQLPARCGVQRAVALAVECACTALAPCGVDMLCCLLYCDLQALSCTAYMLWRAALSGPGSWMYPTTTSTSS
jgi:hypothetical protein